MEISGEEIEGGSSDQAYDALEVAQRHKREKLSRENEDSLRSSAQSAPLGVTDEASGLFCNDQKIEPSFLELLIDVMPEMEGIAIPSTIEENLSKIKGAFSSVTLGSTSELPKLEENHPLRLAVEKLKAAGKVSSESIENLSRQEVPIMALISDGIFKIEGVENSESMMMIQQNYASVNLICNGRIADYLGPLRGIICSCWGAESMTEGSSQWCVTRHLCEHTRRGSACEIKVDPFRTTCISYTPSLSFKSIDYSRVVPMTDLSTGGEQGILGQIGALFEGVVPMLRPFGLAAKLQKADTIFDTLLAYIPSYLANTAMGIVLVSQADELAGSVLFQYLLAAVFGALLAVVWVLLALYRTTETMMKNSMPMFAPGLGALFIFSSSWVLNQSSVRTMIVASALAFWETGAPTPFPWAGKAYFMASMALSVFLTSYFGLFAPKTNSNYVLQSLVKVFGLIMLSQSTSNMEVSCLIVVYGVMQEQLSYWYYRIWLSYTALGQKSSSKLMGRSYYTQAELDKKVKSTTEKELAKLRAHLLHSPQKSEQFCNKLRQGGKTEEATMLSKFLAGAYHLAGTPLVPGTPGYEEDDSMDDMEDSDDCGDDWHSVGGTPVNSPYKGAQNSPKRRASNKHRSRWLRLLAWVAGLLLTAFAVIVLQKRVNTGSALQATLEKVQVLKTITSEALASIRRAYSLS